MIDKRKIGCGEQLYTLQKYTLRDGRGDGRKMIVLDNGLLHCTLFEDGCLDVASLSYKGTPLSFLSKNGIFTPSGSYDEKFPGGMLYTCGLDSVGKRKGHPTHGRIHSLPMEMEIFSASDDAEKGGKIFLLQGVSRDSALFAQNLSFRRRIRTEYLSPCLRIEDSVKNEGFRSFPLCLLYHINLGYPLLDAGASLQLPVLSTTPRNRSAEKGLAECWKMEEPNDKAEEQVFYHRVEKGEAIFTNPKIRLSLHCRFDSKEMPWLLEWKSLASGDYALGLEPSTTRLDQSFETISLLPGQEKKFFLELEVREG